MQHYDNKGNSGFMTATIIQGIWTFMGENLRFKGSFNSMEDVFSGIWEKSEDQKTWRNFMTIQLTRQTI